MHNSISLAIPIGSIIRKVMQRAGIDTKKFTPHSLRYAIASNMALAGQPLDDIVLRGGWSSTDTLQKHYMLTQGKINLTTFVTKPLINPTS